MASDISVTINPSAQIGATINPSAQISATISEGIPKHATSHAPGASDSLSDYYVTGSVVRPSQTGSFITSGQTGFYTGVFYPYSSNPNGYVQGAVVRPSNTGNFVDRTSVQTISNKYFQTTSFVNAASNTGIIISGINFGNYSDPSRIVFRDPLTHETSYIEGGGTDGALVLNSPYLIYLNGLVEGSQYAIFPSGVSGNNLVYNVSNQTISGVKNFASRPTVNGTGVLLSGEASVTGILTGVFYPLNSNPSGYITGVDLSNYVTKSSTGVFVTTGQTGSFITTSQTGEFVSTGATGVFITGSVVRPSETGNFITSSQTGAFYPASNPSGFITGVDLSAYVTGSVVRPSETGSFITTAQTGAFYPNSNPSGFITGVDLSSYVTTGQTGNFITASQTGQFVGTGQTGNFLVSGSPVDIVHLYGKNDQGSTIYKGQPVYIGGANGANPLIKIASNTGEFSSSKTIGLLAQDLLVNEFGYVITEGALEGFDTSNGNAGDPMWLGPTGNILYGTGNKPYGLNNLVYLGVVLRSQSNNGKVYVQIQNGFEIEELHNVYALNPANKDSLIYNSSSGAWFARQISTGDVSGISAYALAANTGAFLTTGEANGLYYSLSNGQSVSGLATTGFNNAVTGISITGNATKTITLFQRDGSTITSSFTDNTGSGSVSVNDSNLIISISMFA